MIIYGSQEEHERVRRVIVENIEQNPENFQYCSPSSKKDGTTAYRGDEKFKSMGNTG